MPMRNAGHSRVFMVMELESATGGQEEGIRLLISRSGQDEVLSLFWPGKNAQLDARKLEDLLATMARLATAEIIAFAGVQAVLPME